MTDTLMQVAKKLEEATAKLKEAAQAYQQSTERLRFANKGLIKDMRGAENHPATILEFKKPE